MNLTLNDALGSREYQRNSGNTVKRLPSQFTVGVLANSVSGAGGSVHDERRSSHGVDFGPDQDQVGNTNKKSSNPSNQGNDRNSAGTITIRGSYFNTTSGTRNLSYGEFLLELLTLEVDNILHFGGTDSLEGLDNLGFFQVVSRDFNDVRFVYSNVVAGTARDPSIISAFGPFQLATVSSVLAFFEGERVHLGVHFVQIGHVQHVLFVRRHYHNLAVGIFDQEKVAHGVVETKGDVIGDGGWLAILARTQDSHVVVQGIVFQQENQVSVGGHTGPGTKAVLGEVVSHNRVGLCVELYDTQHICFTSGACGSAAALLQDTWLSRRSNGNRNIVRTVSTT
mmetsp:Transcript_21410/g.27682  ORF Transcript_21410/g.27682 Transcript_21410/m.27682 type:complete len:338 (-) Transcript_21410:844-1857(-)